MDESKIQILKRLNTIQNYVLSDWFSIAKDEAISLLGDIHSIEHKSDIDFTKVSGSFTDALNSGKIPRGIQSLGKDSDVTGEKE